MMTKTGVDPIKGEHPKCHKFYSFGSGFVNEKPHHAPDEKVRIIVESINTHITPAELCCRHNIDPMTFTYWRESFVKSGKAVLSVKARNNAVKTLTKENESLKKLISELNITNDVLKKC